MKWKDFQGDLRTTYKITKYVITDVECPKCGENIYKNTEFILLSNPAKKCKWVGYK